MTTPDPLNERRAHVGWTAGHCSDPMNCPACKEEWANAERLRELTEPPEGLEFLALRRKP